MGYGGRERERQRERERERTVSLPLVFAALFVKIYRTEASGGAPVVTVRPKN